MRVTEKRIQGDQTGAGTFAVEVLTTVLLNVFAWLTYFSFLSIDLFKSVGAGSSGAAFALLCIFLIPLAAALLTRIPKYGENQLYFWLIPELGLFLTTVFSNSAKGLTTWWKSIFPVPQKGQLMPFSDHSVATTLMFLAICLLTSAVIADDLCVHRRGVPLLSTLVPVLFFVFSKIALPTDKGGFLYRWYFAIYLAILIFAMIFSIGKEKPRAFWKKRINMGISVMLISAIILAAVVRIYQDKDPGFLENLKNQTQSSSMSSKTKETLQQAGMPQGDISKALERPKDSAFFILVSSNRTLTRPVYFRSFTGETYEKGRWVQLKNKDVSSLAKQKILPAVVTGQLSANKVYATLTVRFLQRDISKNNKKAGGKLPKPQPVKPWFIMPAYDTIYNPDREINSNFEKYAKVKLPHDFSYDIFKPDDKSAKEYKIDIANVDLFSDVTQANVPQKYKSAEKDYYVFVKNAYADNFNRSERDVLSFYEKELGWSPETKSLAEAKQDVQQFLSLHFRVVNTPISDGKEKGNPLIPDKPGKDGKYVINQIHLASLETLLLRSEGIPARYVEGYMFDPASQTKTKSGKKYILNNQNTHVWSEVYIQHKGWVPVELGPAQNSSSKDEPKKIRRGSGGNQNARVKTNTRTKKAAKKSHSQTWLTVLLSILLAAIAITALVFAALAIRNKRMLRKLEESGGPENTFRGYRILLRNLRKKRYPASARYPERLLPYLGDEYQKYLSYVYEERYSPNGLNAEERRFCTDFVLSTIQNTQKLPKEDRT